MEMMRVLIVTLFIYFLFMVIGSKIHESMVLIPQEQASFLSERFSYASQKSSLEGISDWGLDKQYYVVQLFADSDCLEKLDIRTADGISEAKYHEGAYWDNYKCENLFCLCVFSTVEENVFLWFDTFNELEELKFDDNGLALDDMSSNGFKDNGKVMCDYIHEIKEYITPGSLACFPINYGGVDTAVVYDTFEGKSEEPNYKYVSAISGVKDKLSWVYADFKRDTYFGGGSNQQQVLSIESIITE